MDIARAIWVVILPNFDEVLDVIVSDAATVLSLDLFEALQGHSDEQVDENNEDHKYVSNEENAAIDGAAAGDRHVASINEVIVGRVFLTLVIDRSLSIEVEHQLLPGLTSHDCNQS